MTNLLEAVTELIPTFSHIRDSPLSLPNLPVAGWQSSLLTNQGLVVGGGCHKDQNTSRRIAIAESIERKLVERLVS